MRLPLCFLFSFVFLVNLGCKPKNTSDLQALVDSDYGRSEALGIVVLDVVQNPTQPFSIDELSVVGKALVFVQCNEKNGVTAAQALALLEQAALFNSAFVSKQGMVLEMSTGVGNGRSIVDSSNQCSRIEETGFLSASKVLALFQDHTVSTNVTPEKEFIVSSIFLSIRGSYSQEEGNGPSKGFLSFAEMVKQEHGASISSVEGVNAFYQRFDQTLNPCVAGNRQKFYSCAPDLIAQGRFNYQINRNQNSFASLKSLLGAYFQQNRPGGLSLNDAGDFEVAPPNFPSTAVGAGQAIAHVIELEQDYRRVPGLENQIIQTRRNLGFGAERSEALNSIQRTQDQVQNINGRVEASGWQGVFNGDAGWGPRQFLDSPESFNFVTPGNSQTKGHLWQRNNKDQLFFNPNEPGIGPTFLQRTASFQDGTKAYTVNPLGGTPRRGPEAHPVVFVSPSGKPSMGAQIRSNGKPTYETFPSEVGNDGRLRLTGEGMASLKSCMTANNCSRDELESAERTNQSGVPVDDIFNNY